MLTLITFEPGFCAESAAIASKLRPERPSLMNKLFKKPNDNRKKRAMISGA